MYIKVRVNAGSKRESLVKTTTGKFEVAVRAPAERNLANRRVKELIASHFKLPTDQVRLISGHRSPSKIFSLSSGLNKPN